MKVAKHMSPVRRKTAIVLYVDVYKRQFERNERGRDDNTYEWVAEGISREKENLQDIPPEICAHWYRMFQEGKFIVFKDLEEIRESDPLQYENLKRQNIHSLVVVPLYDDGKVIAFYGVDNPPPPSLEYASNTVSYTHLGT